MSWVVLAGERGSHKTSFFTHLCYLALWHEIGFSFFCFHHLFDLIKIVVIYSLCGFVAHLLLYTSWRTHYIHLLTTCSLSLQADSTLPLPAREINERKQTIIRELQLSFVIKSVLKTSLFRFLNSLQTDTKNRTKETPWSPLFTRVTTRFARA